MNADALSRNPIEQICMTQSLYNKIQECSDNKKSNCRNIKPQPLKLSPQKGSMIEEPEPECKGIETRGTTSTEGEGVPFTRKAITRISFYITHCRSRNTSKTQKQTSICR